MERLVQVGSIFAVLAFIHMFADLFSQTENIAMRKHDDLSCRSTHSILYTIFFIPLILYVNVGLYYTSSLLCFILCSHLWGDSYTPSYVWAKYVRRPKEMTKKNNVEGFMDYAGTGMGKALIIWVDQIYHLACLLLVAFVIVNSTK